MSGCNMALGDLSPPLGSRWSEPLKRALMAPSRHVWYRNAACQIRRGSFAHINDDTAMTWLSLSRSPGLRYYTTSGRTR